MKLATLDIGGHGCPLFTGSDPCCPLSSGFGGGAIKAYSGQATTV